MAKVKVSTNKGRAYAAEKQFDAALHKLETLPPNASDNARLNAVIDVVILLARMIRGLNDQ